jgi:hypothetical protein
MRKGFLPCILFPLAVGMQACLAPVQMERRGAATFDEIVQTEPQAAPLSIDSETLRSLQNRAETGGAEPVEESIVSVLDRLNANASFRFDATRNEAEIELARVVAQLLRDPSEEVRFRAAELLGKIGSASQEEILIASSDKDPSPVVREMAAESLEHLGLGYEVWTE